MKSLQAAEPQVGRLLKALADPTRRRLFETLVRQEETISGLTNASSISQPAVSQHISSLRRAGLLAERKQGRSTFYRAELRALVPLVDWIAVQDSFWHEAMGRLDTFLAESKK